MSIVEETGPETAPKFGDVLRAARIAANMPQAEVARRVGVRQPCVSEWELNSWAPISDHVAKLRTMFPELEHVHVPASDRPKPGGNRDGRPKGKGVHNGAKQQGLRVVRDHEAKVEETQPETTVSAVRDDLIDVLSDITAVQALRFLLATHLRSMLDAEPTKESIDKAVEMLGLLRETL